MSATTPKPQLPAVIDTQLPEELHFTPVVRRYHANKNSITADKQRAFIKALAETGSVTIAAKVIGNSPTSLYSLKLVPGAESFGAAWDKAIHRGARQILDILVDHAINGAPEYIYKDGEIVAERRVFNYRMMMWIVAHHMPDQFGMPTGLSGYDGSSKAMERLKTKWQAEWKAAYDADLSAIALAKAEADAITRELERRELLPAVLVRLYQAKVCEERRYRLNGQTLHADHAARSLLHLELYMEFGGLVEPEITAFFDTASKAPHPWETEAGKAIEAHRHAQWAREEKELGIMRPAPVRHALLEGGRLMGGTLNGGPTSSERTKARQQAEAQMAEAQRLWEACATEEGWAAREV